MYTKKVISNKNILNAIYIGSLCSIAYLAVYFARNIVGAVTPAMVESGYAEGYIGKVSSVYFIFYADYLTIFIYFHYLRKNEVY